MKKKQGLLAQVRSQAGTWERDKKRRDTMLVLTRKLGESISIGDEIKVILLDRQGNQIRLGIIAPKNVKVYREELHEKIREINKKASTVSKHDLAEIVRKWKMENKISNPEKTTLQNSPIRINNINHKGDA